MAIETFSSFYFDFEVTADNNLLNFDEGGGELTATIDIGSYTLTEFLTKVKNAMDTVGGQVYTITANRTTRLVTISAAGTFNLLISSGTNVGNDPFSLLGFSGSDSGLATSHTGTAAVGNTYEPQFLLQSYIPSAHRVRSVDAVVNRATSGDVEVVRFGTESFVEMNIRFITDINQMGGPIKNNPTGVQDALDFLTHITLKRPIEFMPDKGTPNTFQKLLLETTPESRTGTEFILKELIDLSIPGYYQTGRLTFRVLT